MNTETQLTPYAGALMPFAEMISGAKLLPDHLKGSPADCLLVAMQAERWKLDFFPVAMATSVVRGKLMFEGKLVHAVLIASGAIKSPLQFDFSGEGKARGCRITGDLVEGGERSLEITVASVRTPNEAWDRMPDTMLTYRGTRDWARRYAPHVMLGVEIEDEIETAKPRRMKVIPDATDIEVTVEPLGDPPADPPAAPAKRGPGRPKKSAATVEGEIDAYDKAGEAQFGLGEDAEGAPTDPAPAPAAPAPKAKPGNVVDFFEENPPAAPATPAAPKALRRWPEFFQSDDWREVRAVGLGVPAEYLGQPLGAIPVSVIRDMRKMKFTGDMKEALDASIMAEIHARCEKARITPRHLEGIAINRGVIGDTESLDDVWGGKLPAILELVKEIGAKQ